MKEHKKIKVRIEGTAPLLMNRFTESAGVDIQAKARKRSGSCLGPKERAEELLYTIPSGSKKTVAQPAEHFYACMVKAATNYRIGGKGKKTYKDLVKGCMDVYPELIPHVNQAWIVDSRPVVNPSTRGRVMRHRPRLENWALEFEIVSRDEQLGPAEIKQFLEYAGEYIGIGDYRPRFGRFRVASFKPEK